MGKTKLKEMIERDMSDIICGNQAINVYRNLFTNKIGTLDEVVGSKPWVFANLDNNFKVWGIYAYIENEILHITIHKLVIDKTFREPAKWNYETEITICKKGNDQYEINGDIDEITDRHYYAICGNSFIYGKKELNICSQLGKDGEIIRNFLGGIVVTKDEDNVISGIETMLRPSNLDSLLYYIQNQMDEELDDDLLTGLHEYNINDMVIKDMPIPDEINKIFEGMAEKILQTENWVSEEVINNGITFSILDKYGNEYIARSFVAIMNCRNINKFKFIEFERTRINHNMEVSMTMLSYKLLWYNKDGIDGGIFAYTKDILEESVKTAMNMLKAVANGQKREDIYVDSDNFLGLACAVALSPTFEKLINMGNKKVRTRAVNMMMESENSLRTSLINFVGPVDESKKALHQALGIPKCMFDYIIKHREDEWNYFIKTCKDIFISEPKYLANMCDTDAKEFLKSLINYRDNHSCYECEMQEILRKMIFLFGTRNIKKMYKYVFNLHDYSILDMLEYIRTITSLYINGIHADFKWYFKKEDDIIKESKKWEDAYTNLCSTGTSVYNREDFQKLTNEWRKYEYTDGHYMITYPRKPEEIVNEGATLNHCAVTFLTDVSLGKTTILFLRSCKEPGKPYFTIEVKDGVLRQCHGFNNCGFSEGFPGMIDFLKDFCRKKQLILCSTNRAMGPDDY